MGAKGLKFRLGVLAVLIVTGWGPFFSGIEDIPLGLTPALAAEEPSIQLQEVWIKSWLGYTGSFQGSKNWQMTFNNYSANVTMNRALQGSVGVISQNLNVGNVVNQGAVTLLIFDQLNTLPRLNYSGIMALDKNRLKLTDYDFTAMITGQSFRGSSGIVAVNLNAGHLNNQFTTVGISLGRHQPLSDQPFGVGLSTGDQNFVKLTSAQMNALIASSNNELELAGKQKALATVTDGSFQDFSGVAAVTVTAGNMNQVMNNVQVTINTPR